MSELYRVRWRLGKTEIEVESSDHSYVDTKLAELIEAVTSKKGKTKAKPAKKAGKPKVEAKKADKPKVESKKAEKPKVEAKAEKPKVEAKAEKPKAEKPKAEKPKAEKPKADKPKADKQAAKPKAKAKAKTKAATKRKAPAKAKSKPAKKKQQAKAKAVTADDLAGQIKNHAAFSQIDASILKKPGQLPRVLLCHYFANKLGLSQGLTAHEVESITNELGVRIASPNVAKVIRQKGKKYFSSSRKNGVTVYRINSSGLTAVEQIVSS